MERWLEINEFPGYSVSDQGRIKKDFPERIMSVMTNKAGVLMAFLVKEGRQYTRGVAKLVADHFLPHSTDEKATPLHLNGDRLDNRAENLVWRTRAYANMYHRQFEKYRVPYIDHPILETTTGVTYDNSWHAATTLGLIENHIARSYHEHEGRGEPYPVLQRYHFRDAR